MRPKLAPADALGAVAGPAINDRLSSAAPCPCAHAAGAPPRTGLDAARRVCEALLRTRMEDT